MRMNNQIKQVEEALRGERYRKRDLEHNVASQQEELYFVLKFNLKFDECYSGDYYLTRRISE